MPVVAKPPPQQPPDISAASSARTHPLTTASQGGTTVLDPPSPPPVKGSGGLLSGFQGHAERSAYTSISPRIYMYIYVCTYGYLFTCARRAMTWQRRPRGPLPFAIILVHILLTVQAAIRVPISSDVHIYFNIILFRRPSLHPIPEIGPPQSEPVWAERNSTDRVS
ncbi:hypothetical protein IF1G_05599 [Cordyceps javanica]|uniref:Uncharacterized protein n=1 Tax=Cordyceps javanica TaxID=43265 RepID=A0A545V227_9HYPO|nr:hypothetical protein IF1G_05599 [Cordyceps javanica]